MNIIIYINSINAAGGIERVVSNLVHKWIGKYSIVILTKDQGKSFFQMPDEVEFVSLGMVFKLDMNNRWSRIVDTGKGIKTSVKKLKSVLKNIQYDYIYTTNPVNALEIYLAVGGNKLIASEHGSYYGYNKVYNRIKMFLYPRIYAVSVPNKQDTKIYKDWGANAVYIPHIVSFDIKEQNTLKTKIAINIGRLTSDKRQDLLIRIWSEIEDKNGWKLWIVGSGEEKEKLNRLIVELNQEDSIKIIPATDRIDEIYKTASLFVFTSKYEGFGMVLLEAMSFGIPCISFDCPSGPRDIIMDGYNGYLIKDGDMDGFKETISLYINKRGDQEKINMGNAAYSTAKKWDENNILRKWDEIIR